MIKLTIGMLMLLSSATVAAAAYEAVDVKDGGTLTGWGINPNGRIEGFVIADFR